MSLKRAVGRADRARMRTLITPAIQIATASFGVGCVGLYSLTFFPPAVYRRWLAASPAASARAPQPAR